MKQKIILFSLLLGLMPSCVRQSPKQFFQLQVMSYNVRHCAGMDLEVDYDRTAAVIVEQQPDVVALQELDSMTGRSGQCYQLGELASRTSYYPFLTIGA